jgi:hypothetical protein
MVDPADAIGKARAAVTQRAELPGMSLMEHLDELRKRIVRSAIFLAVGFFVAWAFHDRFVGFIQAPLNHIGKTLVFTHPMDPLNLDLQVSLVGGAILASPFILYQVWMFIAPGLYQKERRFVIPFMAATVGLFLAGAAFGYFWVLPGALKILIVDFGTTSPHGHHRGVHRLLSCRSSWAWASALRCRSSSSSWPCSASSARAFCGRTSATRFWRSSWWRPSSAPAPIRGPCASTRFPCWALRGGHRRGLVGASLAPQGQGSQGGGEVSLISFWKKLGRAGNLASWRSSSGPLAAQAALQRRKGS